MWNYRCNRSVLLAAVGMLTFCGIGSNSVMAEGDQPNQSPTDGHGNGRGVWFFDTLPMTVSNHELLNPFASSVIVGDEAKEDWAIQFMLDWNIDRVYNSFRPSTQPSDEDVARWNRKLHAVGIESRLLLSELSWVFNGVPPTSNNLQQPLINDDLLSPGNERAKLLGMVQDQLLDFNQTIQIQASQSQNPSLLSGRYDGLHLDLEPWALGSSQNIDGWFFIPPVNDPNQIDPLAMIERRQIRRDYLTLLKDTYSELRDLLSNNSQVTGSTSAPLTFHADLPTFFDNFPGSDEDVLWLDQADRDSWFTDTAQLLDAVTLLAFKRNSLEQILVSVDRELALVDAINVGLEADIATLDITQDDSNLLHQFLEVLQSTTWSSFDQFMTELQRVEQALDGQIGGVDIQSFAMFAASVPEPGSALAMLLIPLAVSGRRR